MQGIHRSLVWPSTAIFYALKNDEMRDWSFRGIFSYLFAWSFCSKLSKRDVSLLFFFFLKKTSLTVKATFLEALLLTAVPVTVSANINLSGTEGSTHGGKKTSLTCTFWRLTCSLYYHLCWIFPYCSFTNPGRLGTIQSSLYQSQESIVL